MALLERPIRDELEDEVIELLERTSDPDEILSLDLRNQLLLDDVGLAEFLQRFVTRLNVESPDLCIVSTVESLLDYMLDKLDYRGRCVGPHEVEMLERATELRVLVAGSTSSDLCVATFNVNFALARKGGCSASALVVKQIRQAANEADVVLLQETHSGWASIVDVLLARSHPFRLHHLESQTAGGFSAYSRLPLKSLGTISPTGIDGALFNAQHYQVRIKDELINIFNVHLRPPVYLTGGSSPFSMLETSPIRLREVENIVAQLRKNSSNERYIMAGDFNENDGMLALGHLVANLNCKDALGLTDKMTHWWLLKESKYGDYVTYKRLDHVLCSPGLLPVDCKVLDDDKLTGSDHYCVVAKIRLETTEIK